MVSINKSTVVQNIWKNFYDRLKDSVTSVTLSDSSVQIIQFYSAAFPDRPNETKSDYPILIVNSPDIEWEDFTFTKKWLIGTITIDIFTTKAESADLFIDAIINSIETYRDNFRDLGLMNVNLDSTSKDEFFRGKIKVHMKSCTFSFRYIFTKTNTY